ncbi:MAG: hypothetical protein RMK84_05110 [Oscillochloridaceae bacterium]|nr:hypothetical protein [Chloroflexaceae bacterium]MDW8389482.1 hypothetical protein [Oscillochloridaceae bacterium]
MTFELLGVYLTPAEQEATVRTYHCTTLSSRLLQLKAEGYLTITNKRAVFYAFGNSYTGKSVLQSEVPIADISGINCYKGTYFSLKHLFAAIFLSFVLGILITFIVSPIVLFMWSRSQDFGNLSGVGQSLGALPIVFWILALIALGGSFFIPRKKIWRSVLASTGTMIVGLNFIGGSIGRAISGGENGDQLGFILVLIAAIYSFVCFFLYARRETMSLAIGSKGGSNTPIAISGISGFGLYNTAALRALSAEPAPDAEAMIKELGAMITDIQTLGDIGIRKWQVLPKASITSTLPQPAEGV